MKSLGSRRLLAAAERLAKAEQDYAENPEEPAWPLFMERETTIVLRRALKAWWRVRTRPGWPRRLLRWR